MDCGPDAAIDLPGIELGWFGRWMKGEATTPSEAPLRLFVMGRNEWRDEYEWPLARTDWRHLYFHADGLLADHAPEIDERADAFTYDPDDPVPTIGGPCEPLPGPRDRRQVETRDDVVSYSTEPLGEDLEVTGPISAVLFVETDAPTTAWSVVLVDVAADGRTWGLCEAMVDTDRAVSVSSLGEENGRTLQRVDVRVGVTSYVFPAGHRVRLEVSSSNFPRFARSLNGDGKTATAAEPRLAHQRVHHSPELPSHLVLPTIPPQRGEHR
jgi:putative CocE/NonD family hydrolase